MSLVVLTGAGISADSGVATFRGGGGLWEGHPVEAVATPEGWEADPALVWRFYQERRRGLCDVEPNAAHHALTELQQRQDVTIVTQNVDDLHQRAGSEVFAMHGELRRLKCEECDTVIRDEDSLSDEFLPCANCGHERMRPDVVWFGEVPYHLSAIEAALRKAEMLVVIGTSGAVYPAAGYLEWARAAGLATVVQALDEPDNLHPKDLWVPGRASEEVPRLVSNWLGE